MKNSRIIVYIVSALVAVAIYLFFVGTQTLDSQRILVLGQAYAFAAVSYLYLALIASPLYIVFPSLPFKSLHLTARKAIGVSAFFFALAHASLMFFGVLGGFRGLFYLNSTYLFAMALSFSALCILAVMALTSLRYFIVRMGHWWKRLHRLVYLASILTIIHALLLGSHFADLKKPLPQFIFAALALLLILEAIRFDRFLFKRFTHLPNFGVSFGIVLAAIGATGAFLFLPKSSNVSLGIHSAHQQLAQQASQASSSNQFSNIPGLNGDRTKRYTVSFLHPDVIRPGQNVELTFRVFDASNGTPVTIFSTPFEKAFHLIITDSTLSYFNHLHPTLINNEFRITASFPSSSVYRIYTDFQPTGAIEQQIAFNLSVGTDKIEKSTQKPDTNLTKTFGDNQVTLSTNGSLKADQLTLGLQKISFTIKDAKTKEEVTNLKPYLNTYGHLVMIKEDSYDYLHVHPFNLTKPDQKSSFGPTVEFLPMGIYGPVKPGIYRLFAQFNQSGNLFVADFTVKVE